MFDAVIFFFGAYFLFDNTTFTSNGQVSLCLCVNRGAKVEIEWLKHFQGNEKRIMDTKFLNEHSSISIGFLMKEELSVTGWLCGHVFVI